MKNWAEMGSSNASQNNAKLRFFQNTTKVLKLYEQMKATLKI